MCGLAMDRIRISFARKPWFGSTSKSNPLSSVEDGAVVTDVVGKSEVSLLRVESIASAPKEVMLHLGDVLAFGTVAMLMAWAVKRDRLNR